MPHLLYSTNTWMKYYIQERYRDRRHYVWCSRHFDGAVVSGNIRGVVTPASSNPADIYRALKDDVTRRDRHSAKIEDQKATLVKLANDWAQAGLVSEAEAAEITYLVGMADFNDWRPLVYVIPSDPLGDRVVPVPVAERASYAMEYRIVDLHGDEFDVLEF